MTQVTYLATPKPYNEIGLRALVVDDDPHINRLLQARLHAQGYKTASAGNGTDALQTLESQPIDLILLDVALPDIGGLEVLEQIRIAGYDTAVIITTAFGSERLAIDALRLGADDYLRKPFEPSEFKAVLTRTMSRLLLNRQNRDLRQALEQKHAILEQELISAANIQAELLPSSLPRLQGFDFAAECVPAHEVGGDFYDWRPSGQHFSFWLCDVMGKGMPAALLMTSVRAVMRAVVRDSDPGVAMRYVSAALEEDFARTGRFVTLFMARLDPVEQSLKYIDAGHGHAFILRNGGKVEILPIRGMPLGVMPDTIYQEGEICFHPGDALIVYSDGVIDARPELGLTPELLAYQMSGTKSALAMVDRVVALLSPVGVPPDDFTILVLRCDP